MQQLFTTLMDFCNLVLQSVSQYFETFQCFTKFSFHHKWNEGRLLLINMVYTSWGGLCPHKKKKKRLRILVNYEISGKCPNPIEWWPSAKPPLPPPHQNESPANTSRKFLKNRNLTPRAARHFTQKLELVSNIPRAIVSNTLWVIAPGNPFSILTRPRLPQTELLWHFW